MLCRAWGKTHQYCVTGCHGITLLAAAIILALCSTTAAHCSLILESQCLNCLARRCEIYVMSLPPHISTSLEATNFSFNICVLTPNCAPNSLAGCKYFFSRQQV